MISQQSIVSTINISKVKEEAMSFFKELWLLNIKLSYEECLRIAEDLNNNFPGDKDIEGCTSLFLMNSAFVRNKHKEFKTHSTKTLELFLVTQNKEGEGSWYVLTGASYRSLGNNDGALNYIEKGIKLIKEKSIYSRYLTLGYYQCGEIFFLFNKLEESLNYFNKALNLPEIDIWLKSRILNGKGNVSLKQKNYESAAAHLHEAYNLVKDKGSQIINGRMLSDLGNYYYEIKDYQTALEYETKSYELRKELNLKDPQITNLLHFYKIYRS